MRYFSYDPECGFELHETADEARDVAQANLDTERDDAGDGWSEGVTQICWGELRQCVERTSSREATAEDGLPDYIETVWDFGLVDKEPCSQCNGSRVVAHPGKPQYRGAPDETKYPCSVCQPSPPPTQAKR